MDLEQALLNKNTSNAEKNRVGIPTVWILWPVCVSTCCPHRRRRRCARSAAPLTRTWITLRLPLAVFWVYNGLFRLVDAWQEHSNFRKVFKFELYLIDESISWTNQVNRRVIDHTRLIPTSVKLEVWNRDKGLCVKCGSNNNLHFDHIIPYAKGGSSLVAANIQLLCARHNLEKSNNIE
jgi:hypothetical protein